MVPVYTGMRGEAEKEIDMGQTNALVQFTGQFQAVAGELTSRLAKRGGNIVEVIGRLAQPANSSVLDEVVAVLAKLANIFTVKIGGNRTASQVLEMSGYTSYDGTIAERCVLTNGRVRSVKIKVFSIEHFDHDPMDAEIEAEYARHGLKRPTPDHAIHFGEQFKNLPIGGHQIVFYLEKPVPGAGRDRIVLRLLRCGAKRELRWLWLSPSNRLDSLYLFAGVRE